MARRCLAAWGLAALLALAPLLVRAEVAVPPVSRVTDLTGTLKAEEKQALEAKLSAFEQKKGSQLAVLLVPTTKPETIEQYALRVAEKWKLGRKGVDDGALLLVAKEDRALRIEVGYGLEGSLTDVTAKRIVSEVIAPKFREGDFAGGIASGVDRMIGVIEGEALPAPARKAASAVGNSFEALPVLLVGAMVVGGILRAIFGRALGAGATGGLVGFLAWMLVGTLAMAVFAGVIAFLFTLLGGGWRGGRGGGFPIVIGGGGGGRGGGWSGGGGSFGGGGASGRW